MSVVPIVFRQGGDAVEMMMKKREEEEEKEQERDQLRETDQVVYDVQSLNYYRSLLPSNRSEQFYIDLEFVQNLCNARYLLFLSQQDYFKKPEFLKYLQYLTYWKDPKYAKHLLFPQCLAILDALLEKEEFRNALSFNEFIQFVHVQQGLHWTLGRKLEELSLESKPSSDESNQQN